MYICIYVHMYICTYVYMYICIYVHMYIRICIYVYGHFHTKVSLFPKFEISPGSLLLNTLTQILGLLMILIKQSNQTKLKISLITMYGLNNKNLPCDLEESSPFSSFHHFLILFGSVMRPSMGQVSCLSDFRGTRYQRSNIDLF